MRKWRPTYKAIYVIPEIHGNFDCLQNILNRILPLRIFKNQEDVIIFLGDYIDGDNKSFEVIERLIEVKKECGERAIFLKGNHEDLFLNAIFGGNYQYSDWMAKLGQTTIDSYMQHSQDKIKSVATQLKQIVPPSHIEFLQSLENFYVLDNYFFMHGGFDFQKPIAENSIHNFLYDKMASRYVKDCVKQHKTPVFFDDNYIFVAAHNINGKKPFVCSRYFMLGGTAPKKLLVMELNSMQICQANSGKERIYKYNFETVDI